MAHNGGGKLTPNGGGKLTPNLDLESTKAHNLTVLQRTDPFVEEILLTAAHVTLYDFNVDLNQWSRKDVEGSLFVVKRNTQPRFQFIVLNRRNAANLVENFLGDFEYELQSPYLLYRNATQEVNGIWFYNAEECEAVASLFSRIISAFSKVPTKPEESLNKSELKEPEAFPGVAAASEGLEPLAPSSMILASVSENSSNEFHNVMGAQPSAPVCQRQFFVSGAFPLQGQSPMETQIPALQTPAPLAVSSSILPLFDVPEPSTKVNGNHITSLIKPSLFTPSSYSTPLILIPVQSSSVSSASTLQPSLTIQQHPPGVPLLQPFPSLVSSASATPIITKDEVRDAMLRLAQDDQFVDIVYREVINACYS